MINETFAVVYAQLLTGRKYQVNQHGEVRLEKQWSKQVLPFVYQTVVKVCRQRHGSVWGTGGGRGPWAAAHGRVSRARLRSAAVSQGRVPAHSLCGREPAESTCLTSSREEQSHR